MEVEGGRVVGEGGKPSAENAPSSTNIEPTRHQTSDIIILLLLQLWMWMDPSRASRASSTVHLLTVGLPLSTYSHSDPY